MLSSKRSASTSLSSRSAAIQRDRQATSRVVCSTDSSAALGATAWGRWNKPEDTGTVCWQATNKRHAACSQRAGSSDRPWR